MFLVRDSPILLFAVSFLLTFSDDEDVHPTLAGDDIDIDYVCAAEMFSPPSSLLLSSSSSRSSLSSSEEEEH